MFKVWEREELAEFLRERLAGARSLKDVQDPQALALPPLDENQVRLVAENYPNEIELLGRTWLVRYRPGQAPQVVLPADIAVSLKFLQLPAGGVRLAGGELIEISIEMENGVTVTGFDQVGLKAQVAAVLCERLWQHWKLARRTFVSGVLDVLDDANSPAILPEIDVEDYGACPVTGETLTAYGTVSDAIGHAGRINLLYSWHRSYYAAEQAHAQAVAKLEGLQALAKEDAERAKIEVEAREVQELMAELLEKYSNDLPEKLRRQLQAMSSESLSHWRGFPVIEAQAWLSAAWGLAEQADAVGSEEQRLNRECVRHDFGGDVVLIMGNRGRNDFLLVSADGSLREPDESNLRRKSEGRKNWKRVMPDDLALSWSQSKAGPHVFGVDHQPEGGCTPEQLDAVEKQLREKIYGKGDDRLGSIRTSRVLMWGSTELAARK